MGMEFNSNFVEWINEKLEKFAFNNLQQSRKSSENETAMHNVHVVTLCIFDTLLCAVYTKNKLFCGLVQQRWQTICCFKQFHFVNTFGNNLHHYHFIKIPKAAQWILQFQSSYNNLLTSFGVSLGLNEKCCYCFLFSLALLVLMKWNNICSMRNSKQCGIWLYCQVSIFLSFVRSL